MKQPNDAEAFRWLMLGTFIAGNLSGAILYALISLAVTWLKVVL